MRAVLISANNFRGYFFMAFMAKVGVGAKDQGANTNRTLQFSYRQSAFGFIVPIAGTSPRPKGACALRSEMKKPNAEKRTRLIGLGLGSCFLFM